MKASGLVQGQDPQSEEDLDKIMKRLEIERNRSKARRIGKKQKHIAPEGLVQGELTNRNQKIISNKQESLSYDKNMEDILRILTELNSNNKNSTDFLSKILDIISQLLKAILGKNETTNTENNGSIEGTFVALNQIASILRGE